MMLKQVTLTLKTTDSKDSTLLMSKVERSSSETEEIWGPEEDDMTEGDLGYGLGRRPGGLYEVGVSHLLTSRKRSDEKSASPPPFPRKEEERCGAIFHNTLHDTCPQVSRVFTYRQQSSTDLNSELSYEQLRQCLHEALQEVEVLQTELEASQRQLEAKDEALKILQSMAVLGKATSHTQAVLQKTIEQKRSLEKEINALQWEMECDQDRLKNIEESWTQKYDRLNCDNAVLKENLKVKTEEIKMLKSENAVLNQRYLEALAMLDIKQQKAAQESMGQDESSFTEVSSLELAVLGACLCRGPGGSPCSCARMAASTRKLAFQLRHELELLQKSKEEAHIMADAFRIAFEQQLMRKNDQALRLARMDKMGETAATCISGKRPKEDGSPSQRSKKTLGQKLLGILPSENSSKRAEAQDNPQEVFKILTDLLNDKEEALAHQRKVSYMLARALEDKDSTSKKNKGKNLVNFPLKDAYEKTSQLSALHDPAHPNIQTCDFDPVGCTCIVLRTQRESNCLGTLKRSHSLPSSIF